MLDNNADCSKRRPNSYFLPSANILSSELFESFCINEVRVSGVE